MDSLAKIEKRLDTLLESCEEDLSLYTGKVGISFGYFLLARFHNKDRNHAIASREIHKVIENLDKIDSFSFSRGLLGIGWGLESISQNKWVDWDTDLLLYDFDDLIYEQSCFFKSTSLSLNMGSLGKALYFYQRILSHKTPNLSYRNLLNQECLLLLTGEISQFLLDEKGGILKQKEASTVEDLIFIAQSALLLFHIYQIKLGGNVISNTLRILIKYIEKTLEDTLEVSLGPLYLLNSYSIIAASLSNSHMLNKIVRWRRSFSQTNSLTYDSTMEIYLLKHLHLNEKNIAGNYYTKTDRSDLFSLLAFLEDASLPVSWKRAWLIN